MKLDGNICLLCVNKCKVQYYTRLNNKKNNAYYIVIPVLNPRGNPIKYHPINITK